MPEPVLRLSTDEQQEVRDDPAVQSVMQLFEGDLNHIDADKTLQSSSASGSSLPEDVAEDEADEDDDLD